MLSSTAALALVVALLPSLLSAPAGATPYDPIAEFPFSEGSGLVASRRFPGVMWALRDSGGGDRSRLYAFKIADGRLAAIDGVKFKSWAVDRTNHDWEDLAIDDSGHLWIGDIGNNRCTRTTQVVHKLAEPNPYGGGLANVVASYPMRWPSLRAGCGGINSESLFVLDGRPYLVTKSKSPAVFTYVTLKSGARNLLTKVGGLPGLDDGMPTAADLGRDSTRLIVSTGRKAAVYKADPGASRGLGLIRHLITRAPAWIQSYRRDGTRAFVEGAAFGAQYNAVALSETGKIYFLPRSFYEGP
ncbi:MAG: hypothetical protein H0U16_02820 [Actinobacteria bacterium]|nr:hypothetical protein [Actinomycetota bacterium]